MTRVSSIFSQILQLIPRLEFESAVRQHKAERHARGFTCWGQFIAMLFCQLGARQVVTRNLWGVGCQRRETSSSGVAHGSFPLHPGLRQ